MDVLPPSLSALAPEPVPVLLVDDREENLIALEAVLRCPEYRLVTARSGMEALERVAQEDFALILLDIQMPGMSGLDVSRRLKADERTRRIPVMLITAIFKEDPQVREGYDAGAVDYIGKPFDIEVLRKKVGIYTQLHGHRLMLRRREDLQKLIDAELQAKGEELTRRSAEITTLLDSVADPIYVVWKGRITERNRAALRLFGFDGYDEMTQGLPDFFARVQARNVPGGRDTFVPAPYNAAMKGEKSLGRLTFRNVKTGLDQTVLWAAHPVRFRENVLGVVMVHAPLEWPALESPGLA